MSVAYFWRFFRERKKQTRPKVPTSAMQTHCSCVQRIIHWSTYSNIRSPNPGEHYTHTHTQQCAFKCILHCTQRPERIYHVIYIIQNYEGSFFYFIYFLIRIVSCLYPHRSTTTTITTNPHTLLYVQRTRAHTHTHFTASTLPLSDVLPPHQRALRNRTVTTKGDGRFAYNYTAVAVAEEVNVPAARADHRAPAQCNYFRRPPPLLLYMRRRR